MASYKVTVGVIYLVQHWVSEILCVVFETQRLQEICDRLEDELRQRENAAKHEEPKGRKRSISDLRDANRVSHRTHYNLSCSQLGLFLSSAKEQDEAFCKCASRLFHNAYNYCLVRCKV